MIQAVAIRVSGDKKLGEAMASAAAMQEIKRLRADLSYTRDRLILTRCAKELPAGDAPGGDLRKGAQAAHPHGAGAGCHRMVYLPVCAA